MGLYATFKKLPTVKQPLFALYAILIVLHIYTPKFILNAKSVKTEH